MNEDALQGSALKRGRKTDKGGKFGAIKQAKAGGAMASRGGKCFVASAASFSLID